MIGMFLYQFPTKSLKLTKFYFALWIIFYGSLCIATFHSIGGIFKQNISIYIWVVQSLLLAYLASAIISWRTIQLQNSTLIAKTPSESFIHLIENLMISFQYFDEFYFGKCEKWAVLFKAIMNSHYSNCEKIDCYCISFLKNKNCEKPLDKLSRIKRGILSLNDEDMRKLSHKFPRKNSKKKSFYVFIEKILEEKLKLISKREMTPEFEHFFFLFIRFLIIFKKNYSKVYFLLCVQRKNMINFSFSYFLAEGYYLEKITRKIQEKSPKIFGQEKKFMSKYLKTVNYDIYFKYDDVKKLIKIKLINIFNNLIQFWSQLIKGYEGMNECLDQVIKI